MKIQKFCTWLVVVLFIGGIFVTGIGTLATGGRALARSVTSYSQLKQFYKHEPPTLLDRIQGRLLSFENSLNSNLFGRELWLDVNVGMQKATDKKIMEFGSDHMIYTRTGHLYDLQSETDLTEPLEEIIALRQSTLKDIPTLFVYAQSTLYDPAMLPEDVAVLDHNWETADGIVDTISAAGIDVLDSRDVLNGCGEEMESLLMYTDQHWSSRAALVMAGEIARRLEASGIPVQAENLDLEKFDSLTYERNFLGKYGQRIGADNIRPDDMTVFWPKYETSMHRTTWRTSGVTTGDGAFRDAVIRWNNFENDAGETYSTNSYKAYGLTDGEDRIINDTVPTGRILVIKDSFGSSVNSFLSLAAHEVWGVDLRTAEKTVQEYVDELQPDAVLIVYSQQMLRDHDYQLIETDENV